jgi:hypothetical protein
VIRALVVREGTLDGIPKQRDQLHVREQAVGPFGRERMRQVVWRGVDRDDRRTQPMAEGESPSIPPQSAGVVQIEVVDLLPQGRKHVRVPGQIIEERRASAPLGTEDQHGGQAPERPGQPPVSRAQLPHRGLEHLERAAGGRAHG